MTISKLAAASITIRPDSIVLELREPVVTSCFNFAIGKFVTGCFAPALPFVNSFGH